MAMRDFEDEDYEPDEFEELAASVSKLGRDLAVAGRTMGPKEARFLVDTYYTFQDNRKRAASQIRSMEKYQGEHKEPHVLLDWVFVQSKVLEGQIKRALNEYTMGHIMGEWMRDIVGIGPVISAGLLANLEEPRSTVGQIYAFAGLAADGQKPWEKGEKRPYNVRLKTVCWHAGQSFMKLANHPDCYYGKFYRQRKEFEQKMSDSGQRAETAAQWLPRIKNKKSPTWGHYSEGHLPPSQIDGRARRYAVKLFLSHMNEEWLRRLGREVPKPFALARLNHVDYIPPPPPKKKK